MIFSKVAPVQNTPYMDVKQHSIGLQDSAKHLSAQQFWPCGDVSKPAVIIFGLTGHRSIRSLNILLERRFEGSTA